jgi:23S rRNA (cytosine1962-C5)-methyltransferase
MVARTRYGVVAATEGGRRTTEDGGRTGHGARFTLLELIPETGRPHQIRIHLAHIGCPVVGDSLNDPQQRPAPRLCLHAYQLTLLHPTTGQAVTFTAPVPALFGRLSAGLPELVAAASARPVREIAARTPDALRALLRLAVDRRAPLAADHETTIYRLVNGVADGLPGMTADRYGDVLVLSLYDEDGANAPLPAPGVLAESLAEITESRSVYVKHRPPSASRLSDGDVAALAPRQPILGPEIGEIVACEEGLNALIRPGEGFSVGLFPDMRETRARVRAWAAGKRVLNCFAYTCGFGLAATAGGATRVLNLDLSKSVLEWGKANYRANGFTPDDHDFVYGDVFDWLARLAKRGARFDLVILDPPGFSRTKRRAFSAARDYGALAGLAARVIAADGLLLACCNVTELAWRAFRERVLAGVASSGRAAEVVGVYHEPALDFPAAMRGEPYLKILAARLGAV